MNSVVRAARLSEFRSPLPLGQSDFDRLRRGGYAYVDKTAFIASLLSDDKLVMLFPAPRRFGKSLTLSMLHAFFDDERSSESRDALFAGLAIAQIPDAWARRGQHPVIHLSLKDTDAATASEFRAALVSQLGTLARRLEDRLRAATIHAVEREQLQRLIDEVPDDIDLRHALERLVKWLGEATGKKVLVLIDEYDAPVHRAQESERDAIVELLRNLFSAGLKDNPHLFKGILTGVLRIGKESMFSGLNHVAVHTMLTAKYATAFGFDEFEVAMLAKARGVLHRFADLEHWYDGFMSGTRRVFNPWSVLSALSDLEATPDLPLKPYWANTGDPKRLTGLIERHAAANGPYFEELLSGKTVRRPLTESVAFSDLDQSPDATWAFLVYTGYLTAELAGSEEADFRIPNQEERLELVRISRQWLFSRANGDGRVAALIAALIGGDESAFQAALEQIFLTHASTHDVARSPENGYHMFVLGLLVALEGRYAVRSNREAGFGRYDILMTPTRPGDPGIVIEFKAVSGKSLPDKRLKAELEGALKQIEDRRYAHELWTSGAKLVRAVAVVGNGKRIACRFKTLSEQETQPL